MSIHSKVGIAVDLRHWDLVLDPLTRIGRLVNPDENMSAFDLVVDKVTPDTTYRCVYFDYIVWDNGEDFGTLHEILDEIRHAVITISETGDIQQDIKTDDKEGCDEEFYELLSWNAEVCFWDDCAPLAPEAKKPWTNSQYVPLSRDRLLDVFKSYVSHDAEAAADLDYVYTALTSAGCDDEEIAALGFGYVIPDGEPSEDDEPFQTIVRHI